ncbi:hypothetical protein [uncultured Massilia sp.]|uniref:hypothetical protein n=1 Tax=uncultured Massilia sp. TaxID=169973 RepID=UPI0025DF1CE7|nr:hypothetical protein [uncultured Massilia sp.]
MTTILRNAIPALLLGLALAGAAHAASAERDAVVVRVRTAPEAPARAEPAIVPEMAADAGMTDHLAPRTIGAIAGAIGVFSIASAIRRRRARAGVPEAV